MSANHLCYHWSDRAGHYVPRPLVNRRFLGNIAYLISLGVAEEIVTGEIADCGVSYLTRLAMLQPKPPDRSMIRHDATRQRTASNALRIDKPDVVKHDPEARLHVAPEPLQTWHE